VPGLVWTLTAGLVVVELVGCLVEVGVGIQPDDRHIFELEGVDLGQDSLASRLIRSLHLLVGELVDLVVLVVARIAPGPLWGELAVVEVSVVWIGANPEADFGDIKGIGRWEWKKEWASK